MVPLRSLDETVLAVGRQKSGKSWWLRQYLWRRTRETGGYFVATDPNLAFEDDRSIPYRRYASVEAARLGLAKYGGSVAHVLDQVEVDEVRDLAIELAAASMKRAQRGQFAPVFFMVDESVDSENTTSQKLSKPWRQLIARRRHFGVALGFTMQSVYYAHRVVSGQATQIEVFPLQDPFDVTRLIQLGLRRDLAEVVQSQLQPREHITIQFGTTTGVHRRKP